MSFAAVIALNAFVNRPGKTHLYKQNIDILTLVGITKYVVDLKKNLLILFQVWHK